MHGSDKVTYVVLIKRFIRFYTKIRYALPRLFHMWKAALSGDLELIFTQRFHALAPPLSAAPWLTRICTETGSFEPRVDSAVERGDGEAFRRAMRA